MENLHDYYTGEAPVASAGARAAELRALPPDLAKQCEVVQGILVHRDMAPWLYNLTLSEEVPGFDGTAHLQVWNEEPCWQGVRETAEQLTAIDDWCEAIFAANVVFEPLVGELFRSHLVMHAAPRNGDFVTPTVIGAKEYDYAERDLRYTRPMFHLLTTDREFADHNRRQLQEWLSVWVPRALAAARALQPLWSQPEAKPPRFEDGLDAAKSRFSGIVTDLELETPKELTQ